MIRGKEMTYEQTIELEKNIKIKEEADELYDGFLKKVKLKASQYKGNGRFLIWSDQHNSSFTTIKDEGFVVEYRFLNNSYDFLVSPSAIFTYIKEEYRGFNHFRSLVKHKEF